MQRQDQIVHVNTKFQLSIPMNGAPLFSLKKDPLFQDDSIKTVSTCASSTRSDSSDSSTNSAGKHVHFCDDIITFLPLRTILTQEDCDTLWFSRSELAEMKAALRGIRDKQEKEDPKFQEARDLVQKLFARRNLHVTADSDDLESTENSLVDSQRLVYKEAASILGRGEARGIERLHYGKTIAVKFGAQTLHIHRYIEEVLKAHELVRDCPPDTRVACVAAKCDSLPAVVWALAMADADEEAVNVPANNTLKTELLEV
jgi:hypothetical protein